MRRRGYWQTPAISSQRRRAFIGKQPATYLLAESFLILAKFIFSYIFTNILHIYFSLSSNFVHQLTQVRAGALRVSRYLLKTTSDLKEFNNLQLPYLVCRSLDILLKNEEERIQALKLIRKMILISPENVSPVLVRCLVSLGDTSMIENSKPDRIVRSCLATLSELGVLNPTLLIICNGVSIITRNVLECDSPKYVYSIEFKC